VSSRRRVGFGVVTWVSDAGRTLRLSGCRCVGLRELCFEHGDGHMATSLVVGLVVMNVPCHLRASGSPRWDEAIATKTGSHMGRTVAAFVGMAVLVSCDSSGVDGGATPGGAQGEDLVNWKLEHGEVPEPEDYTVEGKLAIHALPLDSPACTRPLCISSAYAVAKALDVDKSGVFVQFGFVTGTDSATFARPPLNLSLVIDRSASMAGEKMAGVRTAANKLFQQLDERDWLSIVLFDDDVEVVVPPAPVLDRERLMFHISRIRERGESNVSAGLQEGLERIRQRTSTQGVSSRVIVFTDAIVDSDSADFATIVSQSQAAADDDVGVTVFGVGIDLNQELVASLSKQRGSDYAYLPDWESIATVFDRGFNYLVSPLAYNMQFRLTPASGFELRKVYGLPSLSGASQIVEIDDATVFWPSQSQAIVARLTPQDMRWPETVPCPIAGLTLTYEPADGTETLVETVDVVYEGTEPLNDSTQFYSQAGVRRTVAYVNSALGQKRACSYYHSGELSDAFQTLNAVKAVLASDASALDDSEVDEEVEQVARLNDAMTAPHVQPNARERDKASCWMSLSDSASARSRADTVIPIIGALLFRRIRSRRRRAAAQERSASSAPGDSRMTTTRVRKVPNA
jgi:Ca-activated chloride channel homolog